MKTLKNLFLDQLAEMYEAEQQMAKALSRMTKLTANTELREALKAHSYETMGHISKVARIFECFGEPTNGMKSNAINGLLAEAESFVAEYEESPTSDAAIIAAAQKLEHYEIATYGCLRDWANILNNREAANLLEDILDEEKSGDRRLTEVAHVRNVDALGEQEWPGEPASSDEPMVHHGHGHNGRRSSTNRHL